MSGGLGLVLLFSSINMLTRSRSFPPIFDGRKMSLCPIYHLWLAVTSHRFEPDYYPHLFCLGLNFNSTYQILFLHHGGSKMIKSRDQQWYINEFDGAELEDERLNMRLMKVVQQLSAAY